MEQTKHREACDSCHKRKVKCPAEGPGACVNCQRSGRVCIFSPRDEMGRPKRSRAREGNQTRNAIQAVENTSAAAVEDKENNSVPLHVCPTIGKAQPALDAQQQQISAPTPSNMDRWSWVSDNVFLSPNQAEQQANNTELGASVEDSNLLYLDISAMDETGTDERVEGGQIRDTFHAQSQHNVNTTPSQANSNSNSYDIDRRGLATGQHTENPVAGGWDMHGNRPAGIRRSQTWTNQLHDSEQQFIKNTPQAFVSPQTSLETCERLTSILFDLQLELGKTRSSRIQEVFHSDKVFSAAASLCDVIEKLIEEANSLRMPNQFTFPTSESGINEHFNSALSAFDHRNDMLAAHRWLLSFCGCAMIINIYGALCESFMKSQELVLYPPHLNTQDSSSVLNQVPPISDHHIHSRELSNLQPQTTTFHTKRLIQLTVMDFHLSKLERVFDVSLCHRFLGTIEGKKLMQELRETLDNLMRRAKAT